MALAPNVNCFWQPNQPSLREVWILCAPSQESNYLSTWAFVGQQRPNPGWTSYHP